MVKITFKIKTMEEKLKEIIDEIGLPITSYGYNNKEVKINFKTTPSSATLDLIKQKLEKTEFTRIAT